MKRQQQHGTGVVRVKPRALAFGGTKGEEFLEELLVDHDAADQSREHAHGQRTHQVNADHARHVQGEVEQKEKPPSYRFANRHHLAGIRVQGHRHAITAPAGGGLQLRRALIGQADTPLFCVSLVRLQVAQCALRGLLIGQVVGRQLGGHPVVDLLIEHGQAAGQKDHEQQPADDQATPGVQPGHGLGQGLFHPSRSSSCGQKPMAARGTASTAPIQADHWWRAANAHKMAKV